MILATHFAQVAGRSHVAPVFLDLAITLVQRVNQVSRGAAGHASADFFVVDYNGPLACGGSAYSHLMHPGATRLTPRAMRDVALYFESLPQRDSTSPVP